MATGLFSRCLPVLLVWAVPLATLRAENEDPKAPRTYDNRVNFHEVDIGIKTPDEEQELQDRESPGRELETLNPGLMPTQSPRHLLQPDRARQLQLEEKDQRKKNWILPPVSEDLRVKKSKDAENAFGWGWLAEEVQQDEVSGSLDEEAREDDEDRDWLDRQPKLLEGGLIEDLVFEPVADATPADGALMGDPIIHPGDATDEEMEAKVKRAKEEFRLVDERKSRELARDKATFSSHPLQESRAAWRRDRNSDVSMPRTQGFLERIKTGTERPGVRSWIPQREDAGAKERSRSSRSGLSGLGSLPGSSPSANGSSLNASASSLDTSVGSSFSPSYLDGNAGGSRSYSSSLSRSTPSAPSAQSGRSLRSANTPSYDANPYLQR